MMLAFAALFSSAFACGPYGDYISSDDGSFAVEIGDAIGLWNADGSYTEIPVEGELIDMDFVGEDLLLAFGDDDGTVAVLFAPDGEELAEWMPRRTDLDIRSIEVLSRGLVITTVGAKEQYRVRLTDDLRRRRAPRALAATPW